MTLQIGFLVFPDVQQLDLTGPYDVLAHASNVDVRLVWKTLDPVRATSGMLLIPDTTFDTCPPLDVICVPGGLGINALMEDPVTLEFVKRQAAAAQYVTSVCTGSLVLGAAGLLKGKKATTHWASHHLLAGLDAIPVCERVVKDGNLITGGGVTAGIDFGLALLAELIGEEEAQAIQLEMEYAPAPPFNSGSPDTAPKAIVDRVWNASQAGREKRGAIVERVAARLKANA
jgi:cyclohexyl-isocyanide hydratase